MRFRFAARVIAQLGAELISSDDIAIYELIKNAFDAGSPRVKLEIRYLVSIADVARVQADIKEWFLNDMKLAALRKAASAAVENIQPIGSEWDELLQIQKSRVEEALAAAESESDFITLVGSLNKITISDTGNGMDQGKLQDCFLTIGTTNRLREIEALVEEGEDEEQEAAPQPPAGEKGIGRLSAMRLGNDLQVRTWPATSKKVNVLTIDWRVFSPDSPLVRMPGSSGLDLQAAFEEQDDALPIIFLTGHGDIPMSVRAMKAGAVDFLTKPVKRDALLKAIQNALARDVENRTAREKANALQSRYESLTPRERDVFACVVAGKLNKHIATELGTSERTVKAHRAQVMEKMQVASVVELVHLAEQLQAHYPLT